MTEAKGNQKDVIFLDPQGEEEVLNQMLKEGQQQGRNSEGVIAANATSSFLLAEGGEKPAPEKSEFYEFEVDKNVIEDFIHSQNGTLSAALRELAMNAFDADSKTVRITIQSDRFEVRDTGSGFEDKEAIMRNFKCFGPPHEDGDALYGRFRIGRGQIMGFGKITWHSNDFKMTTDIKSAGTGFHFETNANCVSGCVVTGALYTPIESYEKRGVIAELTDLVLYAPSPVFINGSQPVHRP